MDIKQLAPIAQSNAITESRYDFSRIEKNALYCIIRQVRNEYVEQPHEQKTYSNMQIHISEDVLCEIAGEHHRKDAREALISLRHRDITIEDNNGNWLNVGFINWAGYDAAKKVFKVEVSYQIMPYLVDLASRYTVYSLTVAIALKSKWSQRFYELCCQYKNHLENGIPVFRKDINQLRVMFGLEEMYPKIPDFKSRIIDTAQKELKAAFDNGQCDLWFEYTQFGKGIKAEFKFIIHTRERTEAQQKEFKELRNIAYDIYKILLSIFPKDHGFCDKCWKHLDFFPDKIQPLHSKLKRILKNYTGSHQARITRYMLEEDFQMSKATLCK